MCIRDRFQRCAQGLARPLGPAEPQPLCRCGEGFVNARLLAHHAVLKAVRQIDLLCHQNIAVGVGQTPGKLAARILPLMAGLCIGAGIICYQLHKEAVQGMLKPMCALAM